MALVHNESVVQLTDSCILYELVSLIQVSFILKRSVECELIVHDIDSLVLLKNLSFTLRLSGHFLKVLADQELVLAIEFN